MLFYTTRFVVIFTLLNSLSFLIALFSSIPFLTFRLLVLSVSKIIIVKPSITCIDLYKFLPSVLSVVFYTFRLFFRCIYIHDNYIFLLYLFLCSGYNIPPLFLNIFLACSTILLDIKIASHIKSMMSSSTFTRINLRIVSNSLPHLLPIQTHSFPYMY